MMKEFGADVNISETEIRVPEGSYKPVTYTVEPDWSAASYWYALVALSDGAAVFFPGLKKDSLQGDHRVADWMKSFGVVTRFSANGAHIRKSKTALSKKPEYIDFSDAPDLALTMAVVRS